MLVMAIADRNKKDLSSAVALATQLRLRSPQVSFDAFFIPVNLQGGRLESGRWGSLSSRVVRRRP